MTINKSNCKLYILAESEDLYRVTPFWCDFNIMLMEPEEPVVPNITWTWNEDCTQATATIDANIDTKEEDGIKTVTASVNIGGVIYKDVKIVDMTGVVSATVFDISYRTETRTLHVENAEGCTVSIYSQKGVCIDSRKHVKKHETFHFTEGGVYILKCGDTTVKFLVK